MVFWLLTISKSLVAFGLNDNAQNSNSGQLSSEVARVEITNYIVDAYSSDETLCKTSVVSVQAL